MTSFFYKGHQTTIICITGLRRISSLTACYRQFRRAVRLLDAFSACRGLIYGLFSSVYKNKESVAEQPTP